jgi:hypothetical protein
LKIVADFGAGKCAVNIGCEHGILPLTTIRTIVADEQKYKDVAKLSVPGTIKCLRIGKNILLKMEKLSLILISDQQAKGDNVNSTLTRQKAMTIFYSLKTSLYWCLFT